MIERRLIVVQCTYVRWRIVSAAFLSGVVPYSDQTKNAGLIKVEVMESTYMYIQYSTHY